MAFPEIKSSSKTALCQNPENGYKPPNPVPRVLPSHLFWKNTSRFGIDSMSFMAAAVPSGGAFQRNATADFGEYPEVNVVILVPAGTQILPFDGFPGVISLKTLVVNSKVADVDHSSPV